MLETATKTEQDSRIAELERDLRELRLQLANQRTRPQDINAIIDKEIEWHRAARRVFPQATCHFSLVID